jgi:hypothetical protein
VIIDKGMIAKKVSALNDQLLFAIGLLLHIFVISGYQVQF